MPPPVNRPGSGAALAERRTQEERSATTRQAVLDATIACLIEYGYGGTTTTAIQARAGVSRGALTHQFPSKNELLAAAIVHLAEIRGAEMVAAAEREGDGGDRMQRGLEVLWRTFRTDLFVAAIELWIASRTDDDLHAVLIEAERKIARDYHRLGASLFGDLAEHPAFGRGMESVVTHMRGAALTAVLRRGAKDRETIDECLAIMRTALDHP